MTSSPMRIWLVKRTDDVGYDEYDAFVVRANSAVSARAIVMCQPFGGGEVWSSADVEEVCPDGEAGIILGSYNAG